MKNFDNQFLTDKIKLIAGVDEAGRGPLAGPVAAAAVVFSADVLIDGIADSKVLSEKIREELYLEIIQKSLSYSVSVISPEKIDEINILNATLLAMKRAVNKLKVQPNLVLVDGNKTFNYKVPVLSVVKGDSKSFSVAAASILAKVSRDRIMKKLALKYPVYNWDRNKGYPTKEHRECIKKYGSTPLHRKSFLKNVLSEKEKESVVYY